MIALSLLVIFRLFNNSLPPLQIFFIFFNGYHIGLHYILCFLEMLCKLIDLILFSFYFLLLIFKLHSMCFLCSFSFIHLYLHYFNLFFLILNRLFKFDVILWKTISNLLIEFFLHFNFTIFIIKLLWKIFNNFLKLFLFFFKHLFLLNIFFFIFNFIIGVFFFLFIESFEILFEITNLFDSFIVLDQIALQVFWFDHDT